MLYIVLLPVKPDNVRRLTIVHAVSYSDVVKMLGLPRGWTSWVAITDMELDNLIACPDQSITKFICKESW